MHLRFKLTLLSAFVLTACSGGGSGGSGNNHTPQSEMPKVNHQQPQKKQQSPIAKDNKQSETATPKPPVANPPKPSMDENPKPSVDNMAKKELTDVDYFQKLDQFGSDYSGYRFVELNLEGQTISVLPLRDNINISHKSVEILRDNNGTLIGYYGYASVTENTPRYIGSDDLITKNHFIPLLSIDSNLKTVEPLQNVKYHGKMFYHYVDRPAQILDANVTASYSQQNKRLAMSISDDNYTWELAESPSRRDVALNTDPDSPNNVIGRLFVDRKPVGEFVGGIFGSQGEILVGQAKSSEDTGAAAWKGVVGAKAKDEE